MNTSEDSVYSAELFGLDLMQVKQALKPMVEVNPREYISAISTQFDKVKDALSRNKVNIATTGTDPLFFQARISNRLRIVNYSNLSPFLIVSPPLFKGYIKDYVATLAEVHGFISSVETEYFKPAIAYMATMLNSPGNMNTTHSTLSVSALPDQLDTARNRIQSYFKGSNTGNRQPFGDNFRSVNDWNEAMRDIAKLQQEVAKTPPNKFADMVAQLSETADKLFFKLNTKPEVYNANGVTGKKLADIIYTLATLFEFYSAYMVYLSVLVTSMSDTNRSLLRI